MTIGNWWIKRRSDFNAPPQNPGKRKHRRKHKSTI